MKLVPAFVPSKVGGSRKQNITLGLLVVTLVVVYFWMRNPSEPAAARTPVLNTTITSPAVTSQSTTAPRPATPAPGVPQRAGSRSGIRAFEDFRPTLKPKEGTDVSKIDPNVKNDLLEKLRNVPMEGGVRSLFAFGAAPAPPPPPVKAIKPLEIAANNAAAAAAAAAKAKAAPVTPPPAPIPLKFYGYANTAGKSGPKRAFFLDGDDIFVAGENDVIRNRYKIIRIGVNSAVVEDTTNQHQQTLPLVEELTG